MDRCTADAVAYATGVKLGRRSLKFMDYGIMAATFVILKQAKPFGSYPRKNPAILPKSTRRKYRVNMPASWKPISACRTVRCSGYRKLMPG